MNKTIISLAFSACVALASSGTHWGYTGHSGPEHWGELDEKYKICASGKNQSPINITGSIEADLPAIGFNYESSANEILNNGHTVQVNVKDGSSITVDGTEYKLIQYHFHTPSENNIHDKSYPLEAHFVHADANNNLAVVGVMFEEGAENEALKEIWKDIPMNGGDKHSLGDAGKNINDLLPKEKSYYRFNGSLTTPPCSEGVKWLVLDKPLTISKEQVEKFSHAVHGTNNRPLQPFNARILVH